MPQATGMQGPALVDPMTLSIEQASTRDPSILVYDTSRGLSALVRRGLEIAALFSS